jgi:hypothetical protein
MVRMASSSGAEMHDPAVRRDHPLRCKSNTSRGLEGENALYRRLQRCLYRLQQGLAQRVTTEEAPISAWLLGISSDH